jgi:hypothetical protein
MTTLRETFAADFEEEDRLRELENDKELQKYISKETAKMESDIQTTKALQEKMLGRIVIDNKKRIVPEVHFTTKEITDSIEVPKNTSENSVVGKMLARNKRAKIEKLKASFTKTPRCRVRTSRRWN